jgi:hypothetical protein
MIRREAPDFSLSFLDLLLSGVGAASVIVILFSALGKAPPAVERHLSKKLLTLEVLEPNRLYDLGLEIRFLLVGRGDGPGSVIADEVAAGWTDRPRPRNSFAVPGGEEEAAAFDLHVFLGSLSPQRLANPVYLTALDTGIPYRVFWATEEHQPVFEGALARENGFHHRIALDRRQAEPTRGAAPPWFDPQRLPEPGLPAWRFSEIFWNLIDWDYTTGRGQLVATRTPVHVHRVNLTDAALKGQVYRLTRGVDRLKEEDYVALGPRGVCATSGKRVRLWLSEPFAALARRLTQPKDADGFVTVSAEVLRGPCRPAVPADRVEDRLLNRLLADAVAFGVGAGDAPESPITRQDPLLWLLAGEKGGK